MIYKIILSIIPFKYFNINDEWSQDITIYKRQMKIVKKFYYSLYEK